MVSAVYHMYDDDDATEVYGFVRETDLNVGR